jgi:hypothetical protein
MPAPLTDSVILAAARLVDDAQSEIREPSHSDLEFQINRVRLTAGDPKAQGQLVGKSKRTSTPTEPRAHSKHEPKWESPVDSTRTV